MRLYILRHAEAWPLGEQGIGVEEDRFLTAKGLRQARWAGQAMAAMDGLPEVVWSSPWLRARQSAEQAMREWPDLPGLHLVPALVPPGDLPAVLTALRQAPWQQLMIVGHEPFLGEFLGHLISRHHDLVLPLGKGNLAVVDWDPRNGKGELQCLLGRKLLHHLARTR